MKKIGLLLLLTIATGTAVMAQTMASSGTVVPKSYAAEMAKTVMTIWKDSLAMNPGKPVRWSYDQGVVLKGIEGLWKNTGDVNYFKYIQKGMDHFVQEDGTVRTYRPDEYNIDHILCGRNVLMLYKVTGRQKYLKAVNLMRDQLRKHPRTNEGGFWHKQVYPHQMWLDGLYMGHPFYAEYAATFKEDTAFNDITRQFVLMEQHSRDPKTGLLYHGYDESRQQQWANKTTGRSPHFWGRALGWYGMAMVDALEWFPANHAGKDSIIGILNRFADAVTKVQDQNGLWWDIVDLPGKGKNYYEASASSMLVYTLAKGVRNGWLPQKYAAVAKKGYDGIIREFIKVENGQMNLHGTVSVSGLGGKPYRDGSFEYYMSEQVRVNDPKGVGAFIKASNEIEMMPLLKVGAGKTVMLDHYFNGETRKDAFGNIEPYHYVWEEMDNNGFSLFGHVFNKFGARTTTLYEAPTAKNLKGADVFIIVDPDTKKETADPKYMQQKDAKALHKWVKRGGVLALFANDSSNTELDHFNILAGKFGFQFNKDFRNAVINNNYPMGTFDVPAGHPIFKTAKNVHLKEICTINAKEPVQAVFTDKGDVIMVVAKVGKGTVFAVGDPWFYNEYVDGRKLPAQYENYKAMEDMVQWLLKQSKR